jgi:nitroreductase
LEEVFFMEELSTMIEKRQSARWSPTAHNMQNFEVIVVEDRKLLESLGAVKGSVSKSFIEENYRQLSFSEEELKKKKAGILGTMFPPSWRNPGAALKGGGDSEAPSQARLVPESAVFMVVLYDPARRAPASEGDFLGIMSLGCLMQNLWLTAHSLGIGFQILSSFSADKAEAEVKRILGVPAVFRIAFTARLGYPLSPPAYLRVRRDLSDFVHYDRYGDKERK